MSWSNSSGVEPNLAGNYTVGDIYSVGQKRRDTVFFSVFYR